MPCSVLKWYLTQHLFPFSVDPHKGVAAIAVHIAPGAGRPAIGHQERHLVHRLGRQRPVIPLHVVAAQTGVGQTLLGVNEVLELLRVAHEEDRRVVADHVVVALFGVELEGEAARVAHRVGIPLFTRDLGEAG